MRGGLTALLLLMLLAGLVPDIAGQPGMPSVWVGVTSEPTQRAMDEDRGTARVRVEVQCVLPSALVPGWSIQHAVQVSPTAAATAQVDMPTWSGSFAAAQCANGERIRYDVQVAVAFHDSAVAPQAANFVFWANVTLPDHASYSGSWYEPVGAAGGVDIVADNVRTGVGAMSPYSFQVFNSALHQVLVSTRLVTASVNGELALPGHRMVDHVGRFELDYTRTRPGDDRFVVHVQATDGGAVLAERTLTYEVEDAPRAGAEVAGGDPPGMILLSLVLVLAAIVLAISSKRERRR